MGAEKSRHEMNRLLLPKCFGEGKAEPVVPAAESGLESVSIES